MIRMSRAGREQAIVDAIRRLEHKTPHKCFYAGEICREMAITSQTKIKRILKAMEQDHRLVSGSAAIDGYADELTVYGVNANYQESFLDDVVVKINGVYVDENGEEIVDYVAF